MVVPLGRTLKNYICNLPYDSRVPWTARRSNQSILKELSPEYSLEGLRLGLKHHYFGHLMPGANSLEKTLVLGKTEGRRRRRQRTRWLGGITDSMHMSLSSLACCSPWGLKESDMTEQYDPTIPLLAIYSDKTRIQKNTCTLIITQQPRHGSNLNVHEQKNG